jgi:hypothetical protein
MEEMRLTLLYDSTKTLLRGILTSLETADSAGWDTPAESGKQCLYEMHQMSRPLYKAYRTDGLNARSTTQIPLPEKLKRAIPHVKSMMRSIRMKDQATALECGRAALADM